MPHRIAFRLRTATRAPHHRGGTDAESFNRVLRRPFQTFVIRQPQLVVGAKVEHAFAIHDNPCALRRLDGADVVIKVVLFERV